jgi:hypothetical protein
LSLIFTVIYAALPGSLLCKYEPHKLIGLLNNTHGRSALKAVSQIALRISEEWRRFAEQLLDRQEPADDEQEAIAE